MAGLVDKLSQLFKRADPEAFLSAFDEAGEGWTKEDLAEATQSASLRKSKAGELVLGRFEDWVNRAETIDDLAKTRVRIAEFADRLGIRPEWVDRAMAERAEATLLDQYDGMVDHDAFNLEAMSVVRTFGTTRGVN